ncbi:hypothetical protein AAEX37_01855 [Oligella sp. MSHR50489EDL]|uniref:transglycosylase SLT domain-containing protein n=1 Tax=Oligella sp. MSHR50489EDL TaxID=3139409 RepID=UPI003D81B2F5
MLKYTLTLKSNYALLKLLVLTGLGLLLSACASNTAPPSQPENLCAIFNEKPDWHRAALKSHEKWRVPPQILMAIVYQESGYRHDARPPRQWFLGIIPTGRASSAYGYPQAKDEVWSDYKRENSSFASRSNMADALDFIGWYSNKAQQINGTSKWDPYHLYLNYHEGWGGYRRGTYKNKGWLLRIASAVQERSERYGAQYAQCRP